MWGRCGRGVKEVWSGYARGGCEEAGVAGEAPGGYMRARVERHKSA